MTNTERLATLPGIESRIARACDAYGRVSARGGDVEPVRCNLLDAIETRADVLRPSDAYAPVYARDNAAHLLAHHGPDAVRRQYGAR